VSKPDENPYVGLRAFDEKDAGFFIGREEATRSLLDKLQLHRIVFVSGPLGSGKSSLVFAE
jgi:MoxR-like ATPase